MCFGSKWHSFAKKVPKKINIRHKCWLFEEKLLPLRPKGAALEHRRIIYERILAHRKLWPN